MKLSKSIINELSDIIKDKNLSDNNIITCTTDIRGNLTSVDVFNESGWERNLYKRQTRTNYEKLWEDFHEKLLISINPAAKTFLQTMHDMQNHKKYEIL